MLKRNHRQNICTKMLSIFVSSMQSTPVQAVVAEMFSDKTPCKLALPAGADPGGGHGGPMPPPSGLSPRKTRGFATRLAHVATLTQCTSLYESLLHVLHT